MKADTYVASGVPVIRGTNIGTSRSLKGDWVYIPHLLAKTMPNCCLSEGDLVFPHRGAIGEIALIEGENLPLFLSSSMMKFRPNPKKLLSRFAYYYFRSDLGRQEILRFASSVGTPGIGQPLTSLRQFLIPVPPLEEQAEIAAILSVLDDKIELNRATNETLEAIAQAVFRDWFVDFGPVRRKMAGVIDPVAIMGGLTPDPTDAAELAALFPMDFDVSDFPVGWDVEPVIDQANWVNGAAYKKMHFVAPGEGLPVIKIAELKAGVTSTTGFTNTDLGSRYRIDDGELLFSWSGNPDTSIDTFIWTGGPAWLNQHIFAVRPNGTRTLGFLFAMLKYLNPTFAEIARDKQTTGLGHVTKEDLKRLRVVVPPKTIQTAFDMLMTPIFQKLQASLLENRTLAETRDYLLPRLMSGEVRVGYAAQEIAA